MRKTKSYIISAVAAVAISAMLLTGCDGDSFTVMDKSASGYNTSSIVAADSVGNQINSRSHNASDSMNGSEASAKDNSSNAELEDEQKMSDRKLIRTVSLNIRLSASDQLAKVMSDTVVLAGKYNGYISNQSQESGYNSNGSMTVRVPKDKADDFLSELKTQDSIEVSDYSDDLEDVTMQYTDVDSRLQSAKVAKERYMSMLEKAETVSDVLQIQERIDEIIANEESYQRQLTAMNSQIEYTTIQIDYRCTVNKEKPSTVSRVAQSLIELVDEAFGAFLNAFTWFVLCIIWLIFIIPVMCLVVRAFMFAIGKWKKREKKEEKAGKILTQSEAKKEDHKQ